MGVKYHAFKQLLPAVVRAGCVACLAFGYALSVSPNTYAQTEDAGRRQFLTSCGTCHTAEPGGRHRQGPNLHGIFGKRAGQVENFKYSDALARADLVWDEPTLDKWLEDSGAMLPGTVMAYRQRDPEKRRLVIEYLKTLKD